MKSNLIKLTIEIQSVVRFVLIPIALLQSYLFDKIFFLIKLFLIIPYYNSLLSTKFKKFGKNIVFKFYDAEILGHNYIEFGDNILIGKSFRLEAINLTKSNNHPKIVIGNNVQINDYCHFGACDLIEIKNGCLIASRVFITDHFHGDNEFKNMKLEPQKRKIYIKGSVIINENCWIGEGVSIMPNVVIGRNVVIGSNSVVTKSFPDNVIIAGNPARIIKNIE